MIHDNIEYFGAVELTERFNGVQLHRIPENIRNRLNARGKWVSQQASGIEIRFVCDAPHIRLFLSSLEGDAEVVVYCGDFIHSTHLLTPGGSCCIHVEPPDLFNAVSSDALQEKCFHPRVWRFVLPATQTVFHELETYGAEVRPPTADEKPKLTWLAYGSSISAGCGAPRVDLSYIRQTARLLGVDIVNLAMGGACHCEPELANFVAMRKDWDFASFELGVNMRGYFTPEEFKHRAGYFIQQTLKQNPGKPVFLITMFFNKQDHETHKSLLGKRQKEYRKILEDFARTSGDNLFLINGQELMPDFSNLLPDLIHPSASGHIQIANNLARKLKKQGSIGNFNLCHS